MSHISKCPNVTDVLTYWEALGEVSEPSYKSLLYFSSIGSYCITLTSYFNQCMQFWCGSRLTDILNSYQLFPDFSWFFNISQVSQFFSIGPIFLCSFSIIPNFYSLHSPLSLQATSCCAQLLVLAQLPTNSYPCWNPFECQSNEPKWQSLLNWKL